MTHELTAAASDTLGPLLGVATPAFGPVLFRVGLALVVILILIAGIAAVYRNWLGRHTSAGTGTAIRVLNRAPIGRRHTLLLVQVDGRRILVGSTSTNLTALSEWDDVEDVPEPIVASAPQEASDGFGTVLNRVIGKLRAIEGSAS